MIHTPTGTAVQPAAHVAEPCGCLAPDHGASPPCLVMPRFACGQLLTDDDLNQLMAWASDKHRLARLRDGWGVVCGLEVTCDPQCPSGIIVRPGYAVDCCGRDVVVCEDATRARLDLAAACGAEASTPCADEPPLGVEHGSGPYPPWYRPGGGAVALAAAPGSGGGDGGDSDTSVRVVDIYVRYRQEQEGFKPVLAYAACSPGGQSCATTRTRESFELFFRPATGFEPDPRAVEAARWAAGLRCCDTVIDAFERAFQSAPPVDVARRWLLAWIEAHPLHTLCFVRDLVCALSDDPKEALGPVLGLLAEMRRTDDRSLHTWLSERPASQLIRPIVHLLALDCRLAYLSCGCRWCDGDDGVALARVYLHQMTQPDGSTTCRVGLINPFAPYRRALARTCWPAPPGCVNLGQLLYQPWEDACRKLREWGIPASPKASEGLLMLAAGNSEVRDKLLRTPLFACCDTTACAGGDVGSVWEDLDPYVVRSPLTVYVADLRSLGLGCRVLGFAEHSSEPPSGGSTADPGASPAVAIDPAVPAAPPAAPPAEPEAAAPAAGRVAAKPATGRPAPPARQKKRPQGRTGGGG